MSGVPLLVVAGEASGDLHAARLVTALRTHGDVAAFGLGGDEMAAAGVELLAHSREISVVGITEVLKILPRARELFRELLAASDGRGARVALLVDFPDFNLRLARALEARGVRVVYYISPQVWAWRRRRVHTIARVVDRMLVLFPFEVEFYRRHGVEVRHVGHPLVDEVPKLPQVWEQGSPERFRVALLPGSRRSEVEALLPTMLSTVSRLAQELPIDPVLIRAHTVSAELISGAIAASGLAVEVVERDRFRAIADSHLALCASGTATLETGLLGTPLIVLYRLSRWSYLLGRLLVRLPSFSLVNLVLERRVVPELLQDQVTPERIAAEAVRLLLDSAARDEVRQGLGELRHRLGEGGASERAAAELATFLFAPADAAQGAVGEGRT